MRMKGTVRQLKDRRMTQGAWVFRSEAQKKMAAMSPTDKKGQLYRIQ